MPSCLKFRQTCCRISLDEFICNTFVRRYLKSLLKNVTHHSEVIYNNIA